jgi:hypothetical protein
MAIGSAADLIAKRGACTNRVSRVVVLADETLRLQSENPGVTGVIGSKCPTNFQDFLNGHGWARTSDLSRVKRPLSVPASGGLRGVWPLIPLSQTASSVVDCRGLSRIWSRESFWGPVCGAAVTGAFLSLDGTLAGGKQCSRRHGRPERAFVTAYVRFRQRGGGCSGFRLVTALVDERWSQRWGGRRCVWAIRWVGAWWGSIGAVERRNRPTKCRRTCESTMAWPGPLPAQQRGAWLAWAGRPLACSRPCEKAVCRGASFEAGGASRISAGLW